MLKEVPTPYKARMSIERKKKRAELVMYESIPNPTVAKIVITYPIKMEFFLPICSKYIPITGEVKKLAKVYIERIAPVSKELRSGYCSSAKAGKNEMIFSASK